MRKRKYFIAYMFRENGNDGLGSVHYETRGKLKPEELKFVRGLIQQKENVEDVIILNFIRF